MKAYIRILKCCLIFCFISVSLASSDEEKTLTTVDPVTVYATRSPQSIFDVPSMISKVDADASGNSMASNAGDLLKFISGVEISGTPRRNGQAISVRGFDDDTILTLVDGRRQNFSSTHDGRFFIDPSLLKSVEVVKGASSAIYGGGAVGGVVAFETKEAADFLALGEESGESISFGYRSANKEYASSFIGASRTDGLDLLASLSYRDSGDIEQGDGNRLNTKDRMVSALFKAGWQVNDWHTLKFQIQMLENDGREPNNGTTSIDRSNPLVNKEVKDNQFGIKYTFGNIETSPGFHLYYNDTEVKEEDITGRNAGRVQIRDHKTLGFTADHQFKFAVNDTYDHALSCGFEIYHDEQIGKSSRASTGNRDGVPNAKATNYGFYLQDEISFATCGGDLMVIPALRLDAYKSDDEKGHSQDENQISPKFSLSYKPNENIVFFGSWAKAFRAPDLTELYATGLHFPGVPAIPAVTVFGSVLRPRIPAIPANNFVTNSDLKPETVTTIELGAGFDFDDIFASNDRAQIKGSWFTSDGEDFIASVIDIPMGTTRNLNVRDAKITGWEMEGFYERHPVTARLGLSCVEAKNEATGEYLSNNVPITFVMNVDCKIDSIESAIGWRARFAGENDKVGRDETPTKSYAVHDFYYRWTPKGETGLLAVDVGIDNLFDKAYTRRFASLLEAGRSYVTRVNYKW